LSKNGEFRIYDGVIMILYAVHFIFISIIQENHSPYFFLPNFLVKKWGGFDYFKESVDYKRNLIDSKIDENCVFCL